MKAFNIAIVLFLVLAAIFFFTKPTDASCIAQAKATVDGGQYSTPGYENPMLENMKGPVSAEAIFVKDKFLWKEVDYIVRGQIRVVGYAWLGSFHPSKAEKKKGL